MGKPSKFPKTVVISMSQYSFGPYLLDAEQLLLTCHGEPVALGPKVVETLLALVEHPGEVLSKRALLERIWPEGFVEEANLAQNIYVLRRELRAHLPGDVIGTVSRRGYRFVVPVTCSQRGPLAEPSVAAFSETPRRFRFRRLALAAPAALLVFALVFGYAWNARAHVATPAPPQLSSAGARLYAIGRYYWNMRTAAGLQQSLSYFHQVVELDPTKAQGYAALADANVLLADYQFGPLAPKVYVARGEAYAKKALAIDPSSGEALAALGLVSILHHKMAEARTYLQRSITADASYAPAHEWYGIVLLHDGNAAAAFSQLRTAAQEDPLSTATLLWLAQAAYSEHHYAQAVGYSRQGIDLRTRGAGIGDDDFYEILGMSQEAQGQYTRALATYETYGRLCKCPASLDALRAHVFASMHQAGRARASLAHATMAAKGAQGAAYDIAAALLALGDRTKALQWLRRDPNSAVAARIDPRFAALHRDAHFKALLKTAS